MTRELVLWLLQQGHQPVHLRPNDANPLQRGLEEAIVLREQGRPQLSLALLEQLHGAGLRSPWIADNVARAAVDLGDLPRAVTIWQGLLSQDDPAVAEQAGSTLVSVLQPLLASLHNTCRRQGWSPQHLPGLNEPPQADLLLAVLQEAIACREAQRPGLSLELIEAALQQGWSSPWLLDNQARALVNLGRHNEACALWDALQHDADSSAASEARRMLEQYQPQRIRHPLQDQISELEAAGRAEEARSLLLEALVNDPDDGLLWQLLEQRLGAEEGAAERNLLTQELAPVNRRLAAQECLLSHLEARLQGR